MADAFDWVKLGSSILDQLWESPEEIADREAALKMAQYNTEAEKYKAQAAQFNSVKPVAKTEDNTKQIAIYGLIGVGVVVAGLVIWQLVKKK
jgi:hypothetical protein